MSPDRRQTSTPITRRAASRQRGGTYLLVLSMGTVLTVIGLAIGISGRIAARTTAAERDRTEAGVLAASGAELALATINSEEKWRVVRVNNAWSASVPLGDGTIGWKLRDETDDDLTDSFADPIRIEGEAAVGQSRRRFSIGATPKPTTALPVLAYGLYSQTSVQVGALMSISGGPAGTSGTLTNTSSISGDVHAATVVNTGSIAGFVTTPFGGLTVPDYNVAGPYVAIGTQISYWSLNSGRIDNELLTATRNPFGAANAEGVYFIRVPSGYTLRIRDSIIRAMLIIQLQTGSRLSIEDKVAWSAPAAAKPSMIVFGAATGTVSVDTDPGTISVTVPTLNLLGIQIGSTTIGSASSELNGLFHVTGGAPTSFSGTTRLVGSWICEGAISVLSGTQIVTDPQLVASPPLGYTNYDTSVAAIPGSFRWESR